MYCENCGNNQANVKYTQVINGVKKQMNLCEHCANKMGINNFSFSMPMSLFNFMEDMLEPQRVMQRTFFDDVFEDEFENFSPRIAINTRDTNTYEDEMDGLIRKINKERNENKIEKTNKTEKIDKMENKKLELQKRLEREIKEERYEDAAKTRDEIKKIEG
ncbi:MAG: hypothetical protein J6M60_07780 [Clostridia bacterium]|nr:hypothetical protein [Clostridia bacterium]